MLLSSVSLHDADRRQLSEVCSDCCGLRCSCGCHRLLSPEGTGDSGACPLRRIEKTEELHLIIRSSTVEYHGTHPEAQLDREVCWFGQNMVPSFVSRDGFLLQSRISVFFFVRMEHRTAWLLGSQWRHNSPVVPLFRMSFLCQHKTSTGKGNGDEIRVSITSL